MPAVLDPRNVRELHDMRIAAKRLRYVLEPTERLFGPYAADGHPQDEGAAGAPRRHARLRRDAPARRRIIAAEQAAEVEALRARAGDDARDLDPALAARRAARRGVARAARVRGLAGGPPRPCSTTRSCASGPSWGARGSARASSTRSPSAPDRPKFARPTVPDPEPALAARTSS